jgi:tetratricopeptide (TPR) repeat protein
MIKYLFLAVVITLSPRLNLFAQTAEDYFNRGKAEYYNLNFQASLDDYNIAIALNPNYAAAYSSRGDAKNHLNDKDGACKDWSKAIELGDPDAGLFIKMYCK